MSNNEIQRLRAVLKIFDNKENWFETWDSVVSTIAWAGGSKAPYEIANEALYATSESTGTERVREIDEILAIHNEKIAYHRQTGDVKSEYFYRGYNAALRKERNRLTGVGINAKKGDGNE